MSLRMIELCSRVESFHLDDPNSSLSFTSRLARENGWSKEYAARVVREYKRFAVMAVAGEGPVTPSDPVDQAWHLHLCYTRSYWEEFCGKVLRMPLHHEPTRGGRDEHVRHENQYARTLLLYRELFGEEPPRDIWPSVEDCFRSGARMVRVNRDEVWTIPKPRRGWAGLLVLAVSVFAIGCTPMVLNAPLVAEVRIPGLPFLGALAVTAGLLWLLTDRLRKIAREPRGHGAPPDGFADESKHLYERAYLVGGPARVVDTVLVQLIQDGKLRFDSAANVFEVRVPASEYGSGFEREVMELIAQSPAVRSVRGALFSKADAFREPLERYDLLGDPPKVAKARRVSGWLMVLLFAASAAQLANGITHGKPVMFLVLAVVFLAASAIACFTWKPLRNRLGDEVVEGLQHRHAAGRSFSVVSDTLGFPMGLAVSLFGISVLHGTQYDAMARSIAPSGGSSSGGGCSSSGCSSSGCGSGCGGCGGGGD